MSILERLIAAVSLPESENAREDARTMAREAATPGDWLAQILEHHLGLEQAFAALKGASDSTTRTAAFRRLGILLTGHAIAEEAVIYPALAQRRIKANSGIAYDEQAVIKVQMALLEKLDPMSREFINKLGQLEGAMTHHTYCEEGAWFLDLKREVSAADQLMMTERYAEEYYRYVGDDEF